MAAPADAKASPLPPPPPLPRGWHAHVCKSGCRYFFSNDADKQTTWEVPGEEMAVETSLPLGWSVHRAKDGKRFFYWCATSSQSLWEAPGDERAVQTTLPKGWTAHLADDKVHFYYYSVDKKTQWEVPTAPVTVRTYAQKLKEQQEEMEAKREELAKRVDKQKRMAVAQRRLAAVLAIRQAKGGAVGAGVMAGSSAAMGRLGQPAEDTTPTRKASHARHAAFAARLVADEHEVPIYEHETWPIHMERRRWGDWRKEADDDQHGSTSDEGRAHEHESDHQAGTGAAHGAAVELV